MKEGECLILRAQQEQSPAGPAPSPHGEEEVEPGGRRLAVGAGESEGRPVFCPRCLTLGCWSEDRRSGVKWQKEGGPFPYSSPELRESPPDAHKGCRGSGGGGGGALLAGCRLVLPFARRPGGGGLSRAVRGPCGLGVSVGLGGAPTRSRGRAF